MRASPGKARRRRKAIGLKCESSFSELPIGASAPGLGYQTIDEETRGCSSNTCSQPPLGGNADREGAADDQCADREFAHPRPAVFRARRRWSDIGWRD